MAKQLKFSVVTPVYNGEKFILKNLESICNQTYQNIEHIIVNDGSTDNTKSVIENYIKAYPNKKIKLIGTPNQGAGAARNIGTEMATGDYVCYLDADDYLDNDIFEKAAMINYNFDVCFWGWNDIDEKSGTVISKYDNQFSFFKGILTGYQVALLKLKRNIWICSGNAAYRLSIIKNNNIWNVRGINQGEDYYFILRTLLHAQSVCNIPVNSFNCLLRKDSMMHSSFNEGFLKLFAMYQLLLNDINSYNFLNENMKKSLYLYIKKDYFVNNIYIAKKISSSYTFIQINKAVSYIKKYNVNTGISYDIVKKVLSSKQRIEYFILNFSEYLFFCYNKLYYFLYKVYHLFMSKKTEARS
jgi:glycosyltransferase involved in cell wall biosynthesis